MFIQKVLPQTDRLFVRLSSTGKRLLWGVVAIEGYCVVTMESCYVLLLWRVVIGFYYGRLLCMLLWGVVSVVVKGCCYGGL